MKATQPLYEGTEIPKSFQMNLDDKDIWVHGNATEHMYEDVSKLINNPWGKEYVNSMTGKGGQMMIDGKMVQLPKESMSPWLDSKYYSQLLLEDFRASLIQVTKDGIPFDELKTVGNWEFKFSQPRQPGQLPVLKHAQFNGWGSK